MSPWATDMPVTARAGVSPVLGPVMGPIVG
jgi:hypothetical protein